MRLNDVCELSFQGVEHESLERAAALGDAGGEVRIVDCRSGSERTAVIGSQQTLANYYFYYK